MHTCTCLFVAVLYNFTRKDEKQENLKGNNHLFFFKKKTWVLHLSKFAKTSFSSQSSKKKEKKRVFTKIFKSIFLLCTVLKLGIPSHPLICTNSMSFPLQTHLLKLMLPSLSHTHTAPNTSKANAKFGNCCKSLPKGHRFPSGNTDCNTH
jgi:hypothetical protein